MNRYFLFFSAAVMWTVALFNAGCTTSEADTTGHVPTLVAADESDISDVFQGHLFNPAIVKVFDDEIYVGDSGDYSIKRFAMDGTFLSQIGNGYGEGPGELGQFTDFVVIDDTFYVLDPNRRRLSRFLRDGDYLDSFTIEGLNLRMTETADGFALLTYMEPHHITLIDRRGNRTGEISIDLEFPTPMWQSGQLHTLRDGRIVYVITNAGYIVFVSPDDGSTVTVRTVEGLDFPTERGTVSRPVLSSPNPAVRHVRSGISDGVLNVFTSLRDEDTFRVDRYETENGDYLGSIDVPCHSTRLVVSEDQMLCFEDERVLQYNLVHAR